MESMAKMELYEYNMKLAGNNVCSFTSTEYYMYMYVLYTMLQFSFVWLFLSRFQLLFLQFFFSKEKPFIRVEYVIP